MTNNQSCLKECINYNPQLSRMLTSLKTFDYNYFLKNKALYSPKPTLHTAIIYFWAHAVFDSKTYPLFLCEIVSVSLFSLHSSFYPQCENNFNNDRNMTYSCSYVPTMEGNYKVSCSTNKLWVVSWSIKWPFMG